MLFDAMYGTGKEPRFPTQISKALTQLLRHTAMKYKLEMRTDGYVAVEDVLVCHPIANLECTMEETTAMPYVPTSALDLTKHKSALSDLLPTIPPFLITGRSKTFLN
eukprot:4894722-Amphidinium_carterae.1